MRAPARAFAALFMIATLISTLGIREHYLIDLIAALPFCLAIEGIASLSGSRSANRWSIAAIASGGAMTVAWILIARTGVEGLRAAPWLASALAAGTIAASVWMLSIQSRMQTADARERPDEIAPEPAEAVAAA